MTHPHQFDSSPTPVIDLDPVMIRTDWNPHPPEADLIDVSICIANWNCSDYLRKCLESLHDFPQGVRIETIIVDNASTDGAEEMVAREFPDVVLVRNTDNVGFAKASNQAAALATGRYLFFLNNDTLVPAGTLRQLLDYADRHPEAGMIGPRLRGGDGQTQISYRQKPTMGALLHKTSLLRWTGWFRQAYIDYRRASFDGDHVGPVEVLMGAAVFMRREVYDSIGGWDEDYLFGGEDIDLSTRVGRVHSLVFLGDVPIVHYGRISSRQNIGFAAPNVTIGYVHYFRKNGASRSAMLAYKLVVSLDAPVQYILKGLEYYARRWLGDATKAEKSRIALAGIGQFLRSELLRFWKA